MAINALFFGAQAATRQGAQLAYGTIAAVEQTTVGHEIIYVLLYDDGDLEHLDTEATAAATALALATPKAATPPLRTLRRQEADAHEREPPSERRALSRRDADAHS